MVVRLRHGTWSVGKRVEFFYDGIAFAEDGVLELDATKDPWIQRAWMKGYNLTPDGERLWTLQDVQREIERQTNWETEAAKTGRATVPNTGDKSTTDAVEQPEREPITRRTKTR